MVSFPPKDRNDLMRQKEETVMRMIRKRDKRGWNEIDLRTREREYGVKVPLATT